MAHPVSQFMGVTPRASRVSELHELFANKADISIYVYVKEPGAVKFIK